MTRQRLLLRFFRVVAPVPPWMHLAFGASVIVGGGVLGLKMSDASAALAPVFLLQLLAASSGFAVPARRGHYDLLLTSGESRLWIGAAHGAASTAPGIVCWLLVAVLEGVINRGFPVASLSSGTIVAMLVVSAFSWAVTVPSPRLTGGIVWLFVMVSAATALPDRDVLPLSLSILLVPWAIVGRQIPASEALSLVPVVALSLAAVVCALVWIDRLDVTLQVAR